MRLMNPAAELAIMLIRMYQRSLSLLLSRWLECRFYPTCSEYAILAIRKYGLVLGSVRAYRRLLRCRPGSRESCIDYP